MKCEILLSGEKSHFGPGSFQPGSFRPWVVSANFGGSFLLDVFEVHLG